MIFSLKSGACQVQGDMWLGFYASECDVTYQIQMYVLTYMDLSEFSSACPQIPA